MQKLIIFDPEDRLTAEECLNHQFFNEKLMPMWKLPKQMIKDAYKNAKLISLSKNYFYQMACVYSTLFVV